MGKKTPLTTSIETHLPWVNESHPYWQGAVSDNMEKSEFKRGDKGWRTAEPKRLVRRTHFKAQ